MIRWHMQREVIPLPKSVHETRIVQNIHVFDFELARTTWPGSTRWTPANVRVPIPITSTSDRH